MLFDAIAAEKGSKAVGEPFQERKFTTVRRFLENPRSRYTDFNGVTASQVMSYFSLLMSGSFVDGFERTYNPRSIRHHFFTDHNVLKILRCLEMAPWLAEQFPGARHILLVRHPIPTILSRSRNGWVAPIQDYLGDPVWVAQFDDNQRSFMNELAQGRLWQQHFAVWLAEHAFLRSFAYDRGRSGLTILAFEHLLLYPEEASRWIADYTQAPSSDAIHARLVKPSRSTRYSTQAIRNAIAEQDTGSVLRTWMNDADEAMMKTVDKGMGLFELNMYQSNSAEPQGWLAINPWVESFRS